MTASKEPGSTVRITTHDNSAQNTGSSKRKLRSSLTNFIPENVLASLSTLKPSQGNQDHNKPSPAMNRRLPRKSILQEKRDLLDFFDQQGIQVKFKRPPLNKVAKQ